MKWSMMFLIFMITGNLQANKNVDYGLINEVCDWGSCDLFTFLDTYKSSYYGVSKDRKVAVELRNTLSGYYDNLDDPCEVVVVAGQTAKSEAKGFFYNIPRRMDVMSFHMSKLVTSKIYVVHDDTIMDSLGNKLYGLNLSIRDSAIPMLRLVDKVEKKGGQVKLEQSREYWSSYNIISSSEYDLQELKEVFDAEAEACRKMSS